MTNQDYSLGARSRVPGLSVKEAVVELRESRGEGLSDLDLLAVLLGPGRGEASREAARRVLARGWTGLDPLPHPGGWWPVLKPTQGARLAAALELARRLGSGGTLVRYLRTPREVFESVTDLLGERREHFLGLYLNTRNRLLARETISVGSLNASVVHPREVFEPALRLGAASVIVVHNHPSGETDPSVDDIAITRRLGEAGELLGIVLLDHVIVGTGGFSSLKEMGEF